MLGAAATPALHSPTHGYAGKGACCHVLQQGEVGWKRLIAGIVGSVLEYPASRRPGGSTLGHLLVVLDGLGIWLGHRGRSSGCSAEGSILERHGDYRVSFELSVTQAAVVVTSATSGTGGKRAGFRGRGGTRRAPSKAVERAEGSGR